MNAASTTKVQQAAVEIAVHLANAQSAARDFYSELLAARVRILALEGQLADAMRGARVAAQTIADLQSALREARSQR